MTSLRLMFFGNPDAFQVLSAQATEQVVFVGQTESKEELCGLCNEHKPHILIIHGTDDLPAVRTMITECRDHEPRLKVIVYTEFIDLTYTRAVVSAGATGCITELSNVISVLHTILSGKLVLSPQITRLMFLSAG